MTSGLEKVRNGIEKLKQYADSPSSLPDREKIIKQLKIDLTFFNSLPPAEALDQKEAILASKYHHHTLF